MQASEHFPKGQSPFHRKPAGFTAPQSAPGRGLICPLPPGAQPSLYSSAQGFPPLLLPAATVGFIHHIAIEYHETVKAGLLDVALIHTVTSPPSRHDERPYKPLAKA